MCSTGYWCQRAQHSCGFTSSYYTILAFFVHSGVRYLPLTFWTWIKEHVVCELFHIIISWALSWLAYFHHNKVASQESTQENATNTWKPRTCNGWKHILCCCVVHHENLFQSCESYGKYSGCIEGCMTPVSEVVGRLQFPRGIRKISNLV